MITLDVEDHVAVVTMNRAPVNAFNRAMRDRIVAVFDEVSERDDIRVAVLTSSQKVFSAGADLKERPDPTVAGEFSSHNRITRETGNAIMECAKPVIAACNGTALGLGFALLTHCDIMLASEDATFGMPEINVGLAGGASMLKTVLGRSDMRLMFFTGRRLPAAELYRMNVLSAVYKADELMDAAMSLAREIASKSPVAMRYAKASCNIADLMPQKYAYRFEQDYTVALSKTEDAQEARAAFIEKRAPVFKGR
ncbi:enoyl-CoA hydratase/isomerase family protein [Acuticoccus sp. 2012]|uniref:Enoyl-CoA hydratase/isomerase family protein n=2 Tax=Acuticoccus mangrovi TaxID=2796142 RepID=A0A934IQU8_9HYPH|nr:enoyl-CoA hydratase/isomerase family protein [Acuticoccus mangrovi]MBJ3777036.1 enoyl-CoA hydratase/isomerase family protein [Acuticoccus mangrovi]